jgi:archaellum component FlaC
MATVVNPEAGENEDLIVNLDADDTAPPTEGVAAAAAAAVPKPAPVPSPPPPSPAVAVDDLQKQLEQEKAQREAAQAETRRLQGERDNAMALAQEAERRGISTQELYHESSIKAAQDQMDALTNQQESAYNDGNFKLVAEINKKLNRLGGQIAVLEREKEMIGHARQQQKQQPAHEAASTDPIELAGRGRTPRTQQFLRQHPELVRGDGTLKRAAIDAHERALDEGFVVDTEGYFKHIEKVLAETSAPKPEANGAAAAPARQGAPTTAAPVSRGAVAGSSQGSQFVMTPKMRRLAEEQGVAPQDWAREYVRLVKAGRMQPIT